MRIGEIATVKIERADAYDLHGTAVRVLGQDDDFEPRTELNQPAVGLFTANCASKALCRRARFTAGDIGGQVRIFVQNADGFSLSSTDTIIRSPLRTRHRASRRRPGERKIGLAGRERDLSPEEGARMPGLSPSSKPGVPSSRSAALPC